MRDQYNFLKAIDTSSSSPELKESHRPRRQLTGLGGQHAKLTSEAASSSTSSNSNNNNNNNRSSNNNKNQTAGLIKSKLQNLVRPRRFLVSGNSEQKSSSTSQSGRQSADRRFVAYTRGGAEERQSDNDDDQDHEDSNPDDSDEEPEAVATENAILAREPRLGQSVESDTEAGALQQQGVPIQCQTRKRTASSKQAQPMTTMKYCYDGHPRQASHHQYVAAIGTAGYRLSAPNNSSSSNNNNNNNNQYTTKHTSMQSKAQANTTSNYAPSETTKQSVGGRQELAKCYDEIDQIYDYIRGLAPLPANLRKIKAIDFEQIERERQRYKTNQQQQQQQTTTATVAPVKALEPRQIHHQHRQRYVKSIGSSSQSSSVAQKAMITENGKQASTNGALRKLAKVRQRVVAEFIKDRGEAPAKPAAVQLIAPMPIRVTTKSAESQKPRIKRVESLNLGSNGDSKTSPQNRVAITMIEKGHNEHATSLKPRPSYLISSTQRGQLFRLPRAHSTSTLNKPAATTFDQNRLAAVGVRRQKLTNNEPVIQENFPLVRLAPMPSITGAFSRQAGSLGRAREGEKRPSFESDVVESYVDDDDDDGACRRAANEKSDIKQKSNPSTLLKSSRSSFQEARKEETSSSSSSSSSAESEHDDVSQAESTGSSQENNVRSASTSERWSYADDTSNNQRLADKSHSDYDNDSASETSETSATTDSDTTTSDEASKQNRQVRQSFSSKDSRQHSSTGKRSHLVRPTTSSSPSSGRPASPIDMTNESDELEMTSAVSHRSSSFASRSRLHQHAMEPTKQPREEHIYEQIPAHQERNRQLLADQRRRLGGVRSNTKLNSENQPITTRRGSSKETPNAINHPVAYAANVAANRRYQQQVAALFALQQQRERTQQLLRHRIPLGPPMGSAQFQPNHHRRASAGGAQFLSSHVAPASGPMSLNVGSLKWKHQTPRQLADVPHRQRLSMGNIHLLSGAIPFANLCSPKMKHFSQKQSRQQHKQSPIQGQTSMPKTSRNRRTPNANSLDDQEACSTGTTNSTSSYEAAIKNSEPNQLRIDTLSPSDNEHPRQPSSRRSIGSGSGSRSLTNQSHHSMQNNSTHHQTSTLMKVPKLSKQSHLLQRPLPKPPIQNRSQANNGSRKQHQELVNTNKIVANRSTAVNVLS